MIEVDNALIGDIKQILAEISSKIQKKEPGKWNEQVNEWKK